MQNVGSYEVKTHFRTLLDRVAQGEQITITRRGVPVARLVPPLDPNPSDMRAAIQDVLSSRAGQRLDGLSIRDLIDEGRR
jgi:prevent-host-death family protein